MNNKGITLIALIITIIIMLILAGIVITITIGENGLINKAQMAGQNYLTAQNQEEQGLAKLDNQIGDYLQNSRDTVTIPKEEYDRLKNANVYSEEEIEIGTWINNKKIYRKVVTFSEGLNITGKSAWIKVMAIDGIEELISCTCKSNLANAYPNRISNGLYKYENGYIEFYTTSYGFPVNYVIIEYTKTTD